MDSISLACGWTSDCLSSMLGLMQKPSPGTNQETGIALQGQFLFSVFPQVVVFPCKRGVLTLLKPAGRRGTYKNPKKTLTISRQEHLFSMASARETQGMVTGWKAFLLHMASLTSLCLLRAKLCYLWHRESFDLPSCS